MMTPFKQKKLRTRHARSSSRRKCSTKHLINPGAARLKGSACSSHPAARGSNLRIHIPKTCFFRDVRQRLAGQDSNWIGDRLGTLGAADKNQSRPPLREHISQTDGRQLSFKAYRLWESVDCVPDCLLVITERWPPRVLAT